MPTLTAACCGFATSDLHVARVGVMLRRRSETPVLSLAVRTLLLVGLKHRWRIAYVSYLVPKGQKFCYCCCCFYLSNNYLCTRYMLTTAAASAAAVLTLSLARGHVTTHEPASSCTYTKTWRRVVSNGSSGITHEIMVVGTKRERIMLDAYIIHGYDIVYIPGTRIVS